MQNKQWWKEAVVYQIYTRSFCDTNGDGVGDIEGIISRLDYLKDLGVDILWLCPIYSSPNVDNGYDISDYYSIDEQYGGLQAWEKLLHELHARGMKLIMDLVVNHTSSQHKWFQESRLSKDNPYRDYYIWRDGKDGKEPNNWASNFTPSAWELDPATNQYYLHLFAKEQPDLNWQNPKVQEEIFSMIKWWLDKGIDGFRMDAIGYLFKKDLSLDSEKTSQFGSAYVFDEDMFTNLESTHEVIRKMNRELLSHYDIVTVGEASNVTPLDASRYVKESREELNMVFSFEHMVIDCGPNGRWDMKPWKLSELKAVLRKWQMEMDGNGWNSIYLNNHDQPRMVSRFGDDKRFRKASAKALATLNLTLQGTPYIYQGEEIGMTNVQFARVEDYNDLDTFNAYGHMKASGFFTEQEMLERIWEKSRDNARAPMQWNTEPHGGFTTGTPWLQVNPAYTEINVEEAKADPDSILHYYQKMIRARKENPTLVYGHYQEFLEESDTFYCYRRHDEDGNLLIVMNLTGEEALCTLPCELVLKDAVPLISNYEAQACQPQIRLRPYEATVYKMPV